MPCYHCAGCWWCGGVGDVFLAHFRSLTPNWASMAYLRIVSENVHPFMATMYCTHPLMATSSRIMHHVHDNEFTVLKWPPHHRPQSNRVSLGCGETGAMFPGCAFHKSPSTARCYPINMGQHF